MVCSIGGGNKVWEWVAEGEERWSVQGGTRASWEVEGGVNEGCLTGIYKNGVSYNFGGGLWLVVG